MSRKMKDSGVAWIGEIPESWSDALLSSILSERKNKNKGMQEENLLSLSYGNIIRKNIDTTDGLLPASFEGYNIIERGDIVLRLTDLQNDHRSLRTGLCKERGIITSAYTTLKQTSNKHDARYLHYYLHCFDLCKGFYGMGDGVRQGLSYDGIRKISMLLPTENEEKEIADFIDKKCSQIDALISNQQKQIEKLKQYKQSVITEVVTKGLNTDVEMKDSGVEWIGEIPSECVTIRLKYLLSVKSGEAIRNELLLDGGEVPVYGGGEMIGYTTKFNVTGNNILIGRVGARCGCITLPVGYSWATDNALIVSTKVNRKYLYYLLEACNLNRLNTSNAQPLITGTKVREMTVPYVMNEEEQMEISNYLDEKCNKIDSLISIKEQKIEKLNEYKKSVIYEYVTGKKEA